MQNKGKIIKAGTGFKERRIIEMKELSYLNLNNSNKISFNIIQLIINKHCIFAKIIPIKINR